MISCTNFIDAFRTASFVADTDADMTRNILPTTSSAGKEELKNIDKINMGSECIVISTAEVYMLNSNDEWVML